MLCDTAVRLLMQFHITGRCNLKCKHCYRTEGDVETLSYEDVISVFEQFKTLLKKYNALNGIKKRGHVNITGGEPFFHKDIKDILRYLGENNRYFSYGILSNGSFIDDEIISLLKSTKAANIQLSIDGNRDMHDSLRAPGDYDRVFAMAKKLSSNGIRTHISFTANKDNMKYLPDVARGCRKSGVAKLWSDRLVPIGGGAELERLAVDSASLRRYIGYMKKARGSFLTRKMYPQTEVSMNRALQFIDSKGCFYKCSAASSLITVDEFGRVMPCRRLPIYCGDVFTSTLSEIYYTNETFKTLRHTGIPDECSECTYSEKCKGGARCQSYAKYGNFQRADPACPLKKEKTL